MKNFFTVAGILLIIGAALFGGALMLNGGFSFKKNFTEKTLIIEDSFGSLSIDADTTQISILPATDGKCTVELYEKKKLPHSVTVENDTLIIEAAEKKWYDHLRLFGFAKPKITLYLPLNEYKDLSIDNDTGDITVDKAFTFEKADIGCDTGDIRFNAAVQKALEIETDTGDIAANGVRAEAIDISTDTGHITLYNIDITDALKIETSTGNVEIDTLSAGDLEIIGSTAKHTLKNLNVTEAIHIENSTGDVTLEKVYADKLTVSVSTGDTLIKECKFASKLSAVASTGDVIFDRSDAGEIDIRVSTGTVAGTLLSGKMFNAESNTGKVQVPADDPNGGQCEITTSTGKIDITIAD